MARMHEVMNELQLSGKRIPEIWEPYFIASEQKYALAPDNGHRLERQWYRQLNRWLNFEDRHMEAVLAAAMRIRENDLLYSWSQFIRYLVYDTKIIRQDETVLRDLLPRQGLGEDSDLFLLIALLCGADRVISHYKAAGFAGQAITAIFSLIPHRMDVFFRLHQRWGLACPEILTRLAWGKLMVWENIAFEYTAAKLPGDVYKNTRSGEWVMVAKPQQLYSKEGHRLAQKTETLLLGRKQEQAPTIDESNLAKQDEAGLFNAVKTYPDGIWESKFFHTETGGFVGNALGPDALAHSAMRIFEAGYWEPRIDESSHVLKVYLTAEDIMPEDRFPKALTAALEKLQAGNMRADAVIMDSWLLDPVFTDTLPKNHPLAVLAARFKLFPLPLAQENVLTDVFGEQALKQPLRFWPENNELQKQIKEMWPQGKRPLVTGGYFIPEIPSKPAEP